MAKLALFVHLETSESYDTAVLESRRTRQVPLPADQLAEQVKKVLGGLLYVEKGSVTVVVSTVEKEHHSRRDASSRSQPGEAIPSIINDTPSGEKKGAA